MSLFEYFKGVTTTKIPVKVDILARIIQSNDHVRPQNIIRTDPGIPPYKEDSYPESLREWLQLWIE